MIEHALNLIAVAGIGLALLLLKRHRDELEAAGWYDD